MAVKIRLARGGAKKKPFYRIVVSDARSPRDGNFIEKIGSYNPMLAKDHSDRVVINTEKMQEWLNKGAQPTERVAFLCKNKAPELVGHKIMKSVLDKIDHHTPKAPGKKESERAAKKAAPAAAAE